MNYRKIDKVEFDKLKRLFPSDENLWKKYKEQRLKQFDNNEIDVFVIEENGIFIGELTINYISHDLEKETLPNKRVYLEAFRVDNKIQGKGLGQNLINYALDTLIKDGYSEFTIGVEEDNEVAKHIYFKLGFTEAIDKGYGNEFDSSNYILYLKSVEIDETIKRLMLQCDLGFVEEIPKRVSGGLLNRMYKVKTDKGIFAIKLLNPEVMKRKNAIHNHTFAEKIANISKEKGVKSLPAKVINNKTIQKVNEYYFLVFDWFDGRAISDEELSIDKVKKVAKELAKLHKVNFEDMKNECKAYYDINEVDWNFYMQRLNNENLKELLEKNIKYLSELDKKSIKALQKISDNMVLSHRDLDLPNVLWNSNDEPVFIDWESSGLINSSMEVIDTAWNWSGSQKYFDKEKFKTFINTYKENGGDLSDFQEAIKANFKAKSGWLEYNLKRAIGIECIDEEERQLGEKEVLRSIDEINKFYLYMNDMKKNIFMVYYW